MCLSETGYHHNRTAPLRNLLDAWTGHAIWLCITFGSTQPPARSFFEAELPQRRARGATTVPQHITLWCLLGCLDSLGLFPAGWSDSSDTESQASNSDAGSDSDGSIWSRGGGAGTRDRLGSSRVRLAVLSCIQVSTSAAPEGQVLLISWVMLFVSG